MFPSDDDLESARRALERGEDSADESRPFVFACSIEDIPPDGFRGKVVVLEYDEIALFRFSDSIFAISNICPHELSPLLAFGMVDPVTRTVACPLHGWTFEIETGKFFGGSWGIPVYETKIIGTEVWVEEPPPRNVVIQL